MNVRQLKISKQKIHANEELHKIIQEIVEGSNTSEIVMSVAGPKRENKITMTNRNLVLDEIELKKNTKTDNFYLLNDWESIGYCLPLLQDEDFKTVINPSCEHMNDEWYYNIPDGTFIILQSNDFDIPQHTNIVKNIQEMKNKYKMRDIYSCTLQCTVYQRFTLAGIKTAESILP